MMFGAIYGDVIGSYYELRCTKRRLSCVEGAGSAQRSVLCCTV